jgi:hypothetical protein
MSIEITVDPQQADPIPHVFTCSSERKRAAAIREQTHEFPEVSTLLGDSAKSGCAAKKRRFRLLKRRDEQIFDERDQQTSHQTCWNEIAIFTANPPVEESPCDCVFYFAKKISRKSAVRFFISCSGGESMITMLANTLSAARTGGRIPG